MSSTTLGYSVNGQFGIGIKRCEFSFEGNGGDDIDPLTIHGDMGLVASIVNTGTGLYTVTLKDPFSRVLGVYGVGQDADSAGLIVEPLVVDNESTNEPIVIDVQASVAGVAQDIVLGSKVFMTMVFQDNVTGGTSPR